MNPFDEFLGIVGELNSRGVRYALIGGVAMAFHGFSRFTRDVDLLTDWRDLPKIKEAIESAGYFESAKPWRFKSSNLELRRFMKTIGEEMMIIDVLSAEDSDHLKMIENAHSSDSDRGTVRVAGKEDLILLKLARSSEQDLLDIKRLSDEAS